MNKNIILSLTIIALLGILTPVHAAKVAFRLTVKDGVLQQYYDNPDSFPICREKLGYLSFSTRVDPCIRDDGERLFLTTEATAEIFRGAGADFTFTGEETVEAIRSYENQGFTLAYAIIYHEDWLVLGGDGGPYEEDIRILSPQELADVRAAIAASDLRSKDTVKIIQLLGGRVGSHRGDSWTQIVNNPELMAHLENFDGVGTECHVGDHNPDVSDGPETLEAMAQITQWCVQNGDIGFVFMGGAAGSYTQLASTRATYNYLWNEMDALGVAKDRTDLLYFRQGAREGTHLPENRASLTFQVAELIGKVENPLDGAPAEPTSGLVAHWPLDEGSGTITTNMAESSYTAELLNGATWGNDAERGTYAVFDGTNDRISTSFTYALADTNDFTWAWWAKMEPTSHSDSIMVGNRYGKTGSEAYEFIKLTPSKGAFANTGSTDSIENYDYADIAASSWHHYTMVKSGTSFQWYVDGIAEGAPVTINYNETSPLPFLIGGDDDGSGTKVNEHFEGCIDDVVLYRDALNSQEIGNVMSGIYLPVVTLTTLGTAVDSTDPAVWSDGEAAHNSADYMVPDTGNLRGESGVTTFPGTSLTVEAGGKFQILATGSQSTTVNDLILAGGGSFDPGPVAQLAAGTGSDTQCAVDGKITNSGSTRLETYGTGNRGLDILSAVTGTGILRAGGGATVAVKNAENSFSGTWQVDTGSTLEFSEAGAIGAATIDVLAGGALKISDNWTTSTTLTVADAASTSVDVGSYTWVISDLVFGGSSVAEGIYQTSELNALGVNSVFAGNGNVIVGEAPELIVGWETWSATSSTASMVASGIHGSADNSAFGISKWGASTDGTFGTLAAPAASADNSVNEEGLRKSGATDISIDFTVENNTAQAVDLATFYFDAMLKTADTGPTIWSLEVLSGAITYGEVASGALQYNASGSDLTDHEVNLMQLADKTLNPGQNAIFRLSFTGGSAGNTSNLDMDNVALTGLFTAPVANTAPTISDIDDQALLANESTAALAFTIGDSITPAADLTLTKTSSDTTLVPEANIVLGGSGGSRTVTVTPASGEDGVATITLVVDDGAFTATNSFELTVYPEGSAYISVTNNAAGTTAWICPTGVTSIQVECWGGGGAGGAANASANNVGGGGGAGGAYARSANVPVTPGNSYTVTIPAAATAPAGSADGARFAGADVTFTGDSSVTVIAAGGQGGECKVASVNTSGSAGVGSTAGCIGDVVFAGGNGVQWTDRNGGAGGGGAGNANPGGNGVDGTGGIGGETGGGDGGGGRAGNNTGQNGNNPGGGGGGAKSQSSGPLAGGTGGLGQIIITYVVVPVVEPPTMQVAQVDGEFVFSWDDSSFKLQYCTNLAEDVWTDYDAGASSPASVSPTNNSAFFRLIEQ